MSNIWGQFMNNIRRRKAINALALFLIFAVALVFTQVNFAGPSVKVNEASALPPQGGQLTGKLITTNNQPVTVNGASLDPGGTILSGATIEVPDGVGATIDLGPLGQIDLGPNTVVQIEFTDGKINVKVIRGCAVVKNKQGTASEITTEKGVVGGNGSSRDGVANFCYLPGGGGIGTTGTAAIIGGGALAGVIYYAVTRGDNPSNSTP